METVAEGTVVIAAAMRVECRRLKASLPEWILPACLWAANVAIPTYPRRCRHRRRSSTIRRSSVRSEAFSVLNSVDQSE
jgi:hypothetical protein